LPDRREKYKSKREEINMSIKIKAALASAVLALSIGSVPSAEAAKRLTVPDPDWTGGVVTCRTIQYVLEN
jgi:ABC-type proline/glycine betaine transport system substrate-binding protein